VRVWLGWGGIVVGSGNGGSGRIDFVLSDCGSLEAGAGETAFGVGEGEACADSARTASKALFSDLTLFDRGSEDFFSGDSVGALVDAERAREDFVEEKILEDSVDFARGRPDGLVESRGM
jgi:hypothetical protein